MEYELKDLSIPDNNQDIDVSHGRHEYEVVSKQLEEESHQFHLSSGDLEANNQWETDEDFKLRKYFENSQRMAMENGGKPKKMGVSIRNLTVKGKGADASVIPDISSPFVWFASLFSPEAWKKSNGTTFDILHDVTAYAQDGKMLLVLGRPGAGCSTFLRVISNQRGSYVSVDGDVTYGGISSKEWKRYRGEAIYTPEEDTHHPTLTLKETLDFALKCKTPGNRLPDEKKRTFRDKIYNLLVNMFGIVKQADTLVGNEYIRGLSGGERKRLTITEAMVSSAPINCWDCSTRGLDAASALDYAKSLRIMSDTLDKTTIASFYQASDSIYSLFDNVLILEKGRCIYFGPGNKAKQYFLDIGFDCEPRKSIPDFLTGVTNPQERIIKPGFEDKVPETSADFEAIWKKSDLCHEMLNSQTIYEAQIEKEQPSVQFIKQVRDEKSRTNHKKSAYTTSFVTQVIALTQRNLQILWGDTFGIISRYVSILIQSLIYGSVFYQLAEDGAGIFTRGGALFSALLFNAFLSEAELPMTFVGRRILQKHRSYALYRPAALHIAQIVTDFPIIFAQVFLFSIICYFMFGLQYDAGKFFTFCFILIGITLAITNLFRVFGNFCPSMYIAQNILNAYLILMITYVGYTIPYQKQRPWFKWFTWLNPFSYAFKALMINEFNGLVFDCSASAIPYGEGYTVNNSTDYSASRICGIPGASSGTFLFQGEDYLKAGLDFNSDELALNTIVVYLWWLLFIALNMFAMEFFDWTSGGYTSKVYKRGKAPKLNDADEERAQIQIVREATSKMKDTLKMRGGVFTWQNIDYTVPVKGGPRLLLDNIEGWIKPGQMTALMGSSGAGKTTLLDVLAKRKTIGEVKGTSLLNGKPLTIDFERITGYVEQMDVHNPGLTVREALQFSAKLRQEPTVSLKEKYEYVEHVLEMMEMKHLGDALIGNLETGVGISVEERKRLTIGVELVAKPHILFLDEPTSGLDAQSSYNIVKFIRKLADAGMPLVCTIHQPSSVLFEHFDRLLLLAKGGKTVYFGDIGERSKTMTSYFERHGVRPCTESENPAEYILEAIGAGVHGKSDVDWPAAWRDSQERTDVTAELDDIKRTAPTMYASDENGAPREFASSIWYQTWEVYKHFNLIWWRDPFYTLSTLGQSIACALIVAFTFYNVSYSSSDMSQIMFLLFEALFFGILLIFIVLPQFLTQKEYFKRDYASKFYSWFPFAIGIVLVEIPYSIISGTVFFLIVYWTTGIDSDGESGFYFWMLYIMMLLFMCSFGQALGAVCVDLFLAFTIAPLLFIFLFIFCGALVPYQSLPYFWRSWVYHLVPTRYFLEGVTVSVLKSVTLDCTNEDLLVFPAPTNQSCDAYTASFENTNLGYFKTLDNGDCGYCAYKDGKEYYDTVLSWSESNTWRNFGILAGFWIFNVALVIGFVYLNRKAKR